MSIKKYITFIICILFSANLIAQEKDTLPSDILNSKKITKNTIYLQVYGTGVLITTLNYERIFISKKNIQFAGRIGGVYYFQRINEQVTPWSVPLEVSLSRGKKHYIELGVGLTYVQNSIYCDACGSYYNDPASTIYGSLRIGYKYKRENGHFFFLASLTPLLPLYEFNLNPPPELSSKYCRTQLLGVGVGYSF